MTTETSLHPDGSPALWEDGTPRSFGNCFTHHLTDTFTLGSLHRFRCDTPIASSPPSRRYSANGQGNDKMFMESATNVPGKGRGRNVTFNSR